MRRRLGSPDPQLAARAPTFGDGIPQPVALQRSELQMKSNELLQKE